MLFNRNKNTTEELASLIEKGEVKIEELSFNKIKHRDAFFMALKKRPALLSKVSGENRDKIIKYAIDNNPAYFIYLTKEQYTDELAQKFLAFRLTELDKNATKQHKTDFVTVQTSLDDKVLLNYSFVSQDGDEVYYFDNEFKVPSSLKYSFKATLKIINAITLINKLDLHITQLGKNKIKNTLTDIFDNKFKVFINEYLKKNNAGYYSLCANIDSVQEAFKQNVLKSFEEYGIELGEFIIKSFAIPKDIQTKIEDQCFRIRQQQADNDANNEFARKSLEIYETKLAIENKYPESIHSLTEYEKDLALKRYLIKNGYKAEESIDRNVNVKNSTEKVDDAIDKKKDVVPDIPEKINTFKTTFFIALFLSLFVDFMFLFSATGVALILLGVITLIFGAIGIKCRDKFKKQPLETKDETTSDESNISTESNEKN